MHPLAKSNLMILWAVLGPAFWCAAMKLAAAAESFQRSGKFKFSEPKTAAQAKAREEIKSYIRELIGK